jgi:hypothetical protein
MSNLCASDKRLIVTRRARGIIAGKGSRLSRTADTSQDPRPTAKRYLNCAIPGEREAA